MMDQVRTDASAVHAIPFRAARDSDWRGQSNRRQEIAAELPLAFALDLLRMSVILTDSRAQILYANRDARTLLSEQRHIRICMGKLSAVNTKCALQLRQAIRRSTESKESSAQPLGVAVPLIDTDDRSIAAWVLPMRQNAARLDLHQAAIFVRSTTDILSEEVFASTFRATAAELRVLKLLLKGLSTDEVATALRLSRNTVRTHLKALFAKTRTTRQAQLLQLATSFIAPASAAEVYDQRKIRAAGGVWGFLGDGPG